MAVVIQQKSKGHEAAFGLTKMHDGHHVANLKNGPVSVYYEVYGTGKPLVIIHGNGGSIRGRAAFIEEFSKKYKVIAMDNRCHGKSDCPAPHLTYEQIADDLNGLLAHLKVDSTLIWGHSDGATIGLRWR